MISIIVPVYNEESTIASCLERLEGLEGNKEIIVCDGGSKDDTVSIAGRYAKVIKSGKGRSFQMNAGADAAKGNILWFVHSDSRTDSNSLLAINNAIYAGRDGGCFSLYFYDYDDISLKFLSLTSNLRAKYLKLMFGDQGIFLTKDVFWEIGGYDEIPLMEDWNMSRALYRNYKVKVLKEKIGTSGRRFKEGGFLKTLMFMHMIKFKYITGTSPEELAKMYKEVR